MLCSAARTIFWPCHLGAVGRFDDRKSLIIDQPSLCGVNFDFGDARPRALTEPERRHGGDETQHTLDPSQISGFSAISAFSAFLLLGTSRKI